MKNLSEMKINEIAYLIEANWTKVNFAAEPYLMAMFSITDIDQNYGYDSAKTIIRYFLSNASQFKGTIARDIKKELNKRIK